MRFTAAITHEGRWYVARCLEIEVASQGETFEQSLENLKEAIALRLEDEMEVPCQGPPIIAPIEVLPASDHAAA